MNVSLSKKVTNLNEVVVRSRTAPRNNTTSALPIDVLPSKDDLNWSIILTRHYSTKYRL
jgi:hypothetical protein